MLALTVRLLRNLGFFARAAPTTPASRRDRGERREQSERALITGITGQDGSYLAELLLAKGYEVHGMVRRSSTENFERIAHLHGPVELHQARPARPDSRSCELLQDVRPREVYNLAAQSFVPTSWQPAAR